ILAGWVVASLAGIGSAGIEHATGAVPIEDRGTPSLTAAAELVDASQVTTMGNAAVANADVANADVVMTAEPVTAATAAPVTETATDTMVVASVDPASTVEAALPDASRMLPPETPPVQVA